MNKTMKNTVSVTIPAEKLLVGDFVNALDDMGNETFIKVRALERNRAACRGHEISADLGDGHEWYGPKEALVVRRPMKSLTKAQLTKAHKAVQKQQNTLACQAGDLQDALAELERTTKPAKSTYSAVKASAVKVGDMIDSPEFPDGFKKVKSIERRLRNELEFRFATDPVSLCLYADSTVHVLKTK